MANILTPPPIPPPLLTEKRYHTNQLSCQGSAHGTGVGKHANLQCSGMVQGMWQSTCCMTCHCRFASVCQFTIFFSGFKWHASLQEALTLSRKNSRGMVSHHFCSFKEGRFSSTGIAGQHLHRPRPGSIFIDRDPAPFSLVLNIPAWRALWQPAHYGTVPSAMLLSCTPLPFSLCS